MDTRDQICHANTGFNCTPLRNPAANVTCNKQKMRFMEISSIYKKLRYFSNPYYLFSLFTSSPSPLPLSSLPKTLIYLKPSISHSTTNPSSHPLYCTNPSTGSPSFSSVKSLSSHCYSCNSYKSSVLLNNGWLRFHVHTFFRSFSVLSPDASSTSRRPETVNSLNNSELLGVSSKSVWEIIEIIQRNDSDLESKLNMMNVKLSTDSVFEIFSVLSCKRVSALRFFDWIRKSQPDLSVKPDICSLAIDNCGWLNDYEAMICLLKDFSSKRLCLTKKAFGFLPIFGSSEASLKDFIGRLVEVLNEIGGSCRSTGIRAMIEMFAGMGFFVIAKYVIEITERNNSYYNILIRELCRRRNYKEAKEILEEMWRLGCDPDAKSYNYLLSSLCKNEMIAETYSVFGEMQEKGCSPDALTFEILIFYLCRHGKLEVVSEFFNQMAAINIEPRLSTHAAFIKSYFKFGKYEEAYSYVVHSGVKYKCSSNENYSLLAGLHQEKGNLITAQKILMEMMDKGLKPNFSVYVRVLKYLQKAGKNNLANDLRGGFSRLTIQPSLETG